MTPTSRGRLLRWGVDPSARWPAQTFVRRLVEAARVYAPIRAALREQRTTSVRLTATEAADFLAAGAAALAEAGVEVRLADELVAHRLRASDGAAFRCEAMAGEHSLTREDAERLAAVGRPLMRWNGAWILIDPAIAPGIAAMAEKEVSLPEAQVFAGALSGERETRELGAVEVIAEGWTAAVAGELRHVGRDREPQLCGSGGRRPRPRRWPGWTGSSRPRSRRTV